VGNYGGIGCQPRPWKLGHRLNERAATCCTTGPCLWVVMATLLLNTTKVTIKIVATPQDPASFQNGRIHLTNLFAAWSTWCIASARALEVASLKRLGKSECFSIAKMKLFKPALIYHHRLCLLLAFFWPLDDPIFGLLVCLAYLVIGF